MYNPHEPYDAETYIQTTAGVKVSRDAVLCGAQFVEMPGGKSVIMPGVVIRGDLAAVRIQRYCQIGKNTVIRPSHITAGESTVKFIPVQIGKYSRVGDDCVIEAASIGRGCDIGHNCVLMPRCILKDYVRIEAGAVVAADMVIPPFSIVAGSPARIIGEQPESVSTTAEIEAKARYKMFQPVTIQ